MIEIILVILSFYLKNYLSEHSETITDQMYYDIDLEDGEIITLERIIISDFEKQEDLETETITISCQLTIYYTTD